MRIEDLEQVLARIPQKHLRIRIRNAVTNFEFSERKEQYGDDLLEFAYLIPNLGKKSCAALRAAAEANGIA